LTGNIPTVEVDIKAFHADPYDALTSMREHTPKCHFANPPFRHSGV